MDILINYIDFFIILTVIIIFAIYRIFKNRPKFKIWYQINKKNHLRNIVNKISSKLSLNAKFNYYKKYKQKEELLKFTKLVLQLTSRKEQQFNFNTWEISDLKYYLSERFIDNYKKYIIGIGFEKEKAIERFSDNYINKNIAKVIIRTYHNIAFTSSPIEENREILKKIKKEIEMDSIEFEYNFKDFITFMTFIILTFLLSYRGFKLVGSIFQLVSGIRQY